MTFEKEDEVRTNWEKMRANQFVKRKLVLTDTPPQTSVHKTHMRGAWRWHYFVEWKTTFGSWVGLGGWTHTKTEARKKAQALIEQNPLGDNPTQGD